LKINFKANNRFFAIGGIGVAENRGKFR
jgi:hypothetical protein